MKRINSYLDTAFMKWVVFPLLLLFAWFTATFIYASIYNGSYTVISINHDTGIFTYVPEGRILKGQIVRGEFTAQNDNLGIVAIRFKQQQRIAWTNEDIFIFRIKEKGATEWYYQNQYYSGLTYDVPFLPIGFPLIPDSKGKKYQFELESTKGNKVNGLIISDKKPVFASRYQMDKSELVSDSSLLLNFLFTKLVNTFDTPDIFYSSVIYLLPFLLYMAWLSGVLKPFTEFLFRYYKKQTLKKNLSQLYGRNTIVGVWFNVIIVFAILYDILLLQVLNDMVYIVLIGMWIYLQRLVHAKTIISFIVAIIFIFISLLLNEFNSITAAEKAAAWAFIFLAGGVFIDIIQLRKTKK